MKFVEADHERHQDGKFAEKLGSAAEITLAREAYTPGQYVTYTYQEDGETVTLHGAVLQADDAPGTHTLLLEDGNMWSGIPTSELQEDTAQDASANVARHARFNAARDVAQAIGFGKVSQSERMHLADIESGINEGMNEEWRNQAARAFVQFKQEDADALSPEARLRELLDETADTHLRALERMGILPDEQYEQDISRRTALAVLYRDRIDDSSDNWTQDHYDHLTRAWREAVGPVHPDDEPRPASWDVTQHTAMSPARKYESYSDAEVSSLRDNAWLEYRESPDGLKLRAAQVLDAALGHRGIQ